MIGILLTGNHLRIKITHPSFINRLEETFGLIKVKKIMLLFLNSLDYYSDEELLIKLKQIDTLVPEMKKFASEFPETTIMNTVKLPRLSKREERGLRDEIKTILHLISHKIQLQASEDKLEEMREYRKKIFKAYSKPLLKLKDIEEKRVERLERELSESRQKLYYILKQDTD